MWRVPRSQSGSLSLSLLHCSSRKCLEGARTRRIVGHIILLFKFVRSWAFLSFKIFFMNAFSVGIRKWFGTFLLVPHLQSSVAFFPDFRWFVASSLRNIADSSFPCLPSREFLVRVRYVPYHATVLGLRTINVVFRAVTLHMEPSNLKTIVLSPFICRLLLAACPWLCNN